MRFAPGAICALVILCCAATPLLAQNSEALKHARNGYEYEQQQEYRLALFEYDTAIKLDPKYPYPYEHIGSMYQVLKNYRLAITYYSQAIKLDSNYDVYNYFNLGPCYRILGKHDSAVLVLKQFIRRMQPVNREDSLNMKDADWWIKFNLGCIVEKSKPKNTEEPVPLTDINSPKYDDFAPSVTADGETLYFTSRRPNPNRKQQIETGDYGDDLFVSHWDRLKLIWAPPTPVPAPLNATDDEGAATVSADGQTLWFSLCRQTDGVGDCDLYKSDLVGDQWTKPLNLGRPLNSPQWDAQPSLTGDGLTMYFASRRAESMDSSEDIYVSYKGTDGRWTPPHNLGEPVNTRFNERSPFISADGRTLYFSSNGHPGWGNHDLFMSRLLDDGTWSEPVNLGQPINSYGDDAFLTIPARGDKIIYASQRADARGALHLYEAKLPPQFRPGPVTLVAGTVYDRDSHEPLSARVDVNDLKTDQLVATYHTNKITGKFYITLRTGKLYGITAVADGYVHYSDSVQVPDTISYREVTHDMGLAKLPTIASKTPSGKTPVVKEPGVKQPGGKQPGVKQPGGKQPGGKQPVVKQPGGKQPSGKQPGENGGIDTTNGLSQPIKLNNIFFGFDSARLRPESRTELRYLTEMLQKYPEYRIQIEGHTDSIGTPAYNHWLSQARADSVRSYLVQQGIAANRLVARGFGATRPIESNATVEGRRKNRRTEFRFIQ